MLWLEQKYISLISSRLERFEITRHAPYMAVTRCPLCGDSQKSKWKRRGYFYEEKGVIYYKCHNCNESTHCSEIIRQLDEPLFKQYITEKYINKGKVEKITEKKKEVPKTPFGDLLPIAHLPADHPARVYLENRQIPKKYLFQIRYCAQFMHWVNSFMPGKFRDETLSLDEPRIIIPFLNKQNVLTGFSARSLKVESVNRYISIMVREEPKVYGLNLVNDDEFYYILEGPIDSMFVENSIAMVGTSVPLKQLHLKEQNAIFVFDNENRNKEVIQKIEKTIKSGYKVVIWPKGFQFKDVNEAISGGHSVASIRHILEKCTCHGLMAELKLNEWRKV